MEIIKNNNWNNKKDENKQNGHKILIVLDLVLFCLVLLALAAGALAEPFGITVLSIWIVVFLATVVSFTAHLSEGAGEWFTYGSSLMVGALVAIVVSIVFGLGVWGAIILLPLAIAGIFVINWMFTDRSEEAIGKDLAKLKREMEKEG